MAKRFGYMVPTPNGTVDIMMGPPATDETLAEYAAITAVITTLQPLVIAMMICEQEYAALAALPVQNGVTFSASTGPVMPSTAVFDFLTSATRAVAANLAAGSAFLNQAERIVARLFGKGSPQDLAWNAERRTLHAGSVGYRVMQDLRHYAQHYGLPVSEVNVQGLRANDAASMTFTLNIRLTRDHLLRSGFEWRAKRRDDLNGLSAQFEVLPLAEEYLSCLRTLLLSIVREFGDQLLACRDYLQTVRRVLKVPAAGRIFLFDVPAHAVDPEATPPPIAHPQRGEVVPEDQYSWLLTQLASIAPARAVGADAGVAGNGATGGDDPPAAPGSRG